MAHAHIDLWSVKPEVSLTNTGEFKLKAGPISISMDRATAVALALNLLAVANPVSNQLQAVA